MKISKLLAEYLLVKACDKYNIDSEDIKDLDHRNVSVLHFHQYDSGNINFLIVVDTIGVMNATYVPDEFVSKVNFHTYTLGED